MLQVQYFRGNILFVLPFLITYNFQCEFYKLLYNIGSFKN